MQGRGLGELPDSPRSPDPFTAPPAGSGLVPSSARACFHQSEASWRHSLSPGYPWVLPGAGAGEAGAPTGNLCLSLYRRPVSGCLRKGGEAPALGLPASGSPGAQSRGVAAGGRGGAGRGVPERRGRPA